MGFIDQASIKVFAGSGGNGMTSFRREKGISKGGPDGGDGGKGGDVYLIGSNNTDGLSRFRHIKKYQAEAGKDGYRSRSTGKSGADLYLEVPLGTVVYQENILPREILVAGSSLLVAKGGRGGLGNAHFKSNRLKAPDFNEKGSAGEVVSLDLELKLIADVGLVGLPNAGKSTLLNKLSDTKAKVGNYAFTTLSPGLGVIKNTEDKIIVADLPGIIAEAHQGKGLGLQFLKHIERTKLKIFVIDFFNDVKIDYLTLTNELKQYNKQILNDNFLIVVNKIDGVDKNYIDDKVASLSRELELLPELIIPLSAKTGENLDLLVGKIIDKIKEIKQIEYPTISQDKVFEINLSSLNEIWQLELKNNNLELTGKEIEELVLRQNLNNWNSLNRLYWIFAKKGIIKQAQKLLGSNYPIIYCAGNKIDFTGLQDS